MSIVSAIERLAEREAKNPVVVRTFHTAWEAALGAGVAAVSTTHGDVREIIAVAVAAGLAALKTAIVRAVESKAAVPALIVSTEPAPVVVTQVDTPSTPASPSVGQPVGLDSPVTPPPAQ